MGFDVISSRVEEQVRSGLMDETHRREVDAVSRDLRAAPRPGRGRSASVSVLDAAIDAAERRIASDVGAHPIDVLQAILRRMPVARMHPNWAPTATLALSRYGQVTDHSRLHESGTGTVLLVDLQDLDDAIEASFRITMAVESLCGLVDQRRIVGKGAKLHLPDGVPFAIETTPELDLAFRRYDERRTEEARPLLDQGVLLPDADDDTGAFIGLGRLGAVVRVHVPERAIDLLINYVPIALPAGGVRRVLEQYRDPIEDRFGVTVDEVLHVLHALGARIASSIRWPEPDATGDRLVLRSTGDADADDQMLNTTWSLLNQGILRRTVEGWVRELAPVTTTAMPTEHASAAAVRHFLDAFIAAGTPTELDLRSLTPTPLLLQGGDAAVYLDVAGIVGWLESLIRLGQSWYESEHGDRFHLAVGRWLRTELPEHQVIDRYRFTDANGRDRVGDLAIVSDDLIACVECKAWRKLPALLRGDPRAVSTRREQVRRAVAQVGEAVTSVEAGTADLQPAGRRVIGVVCTPGPEFLVPFDTFGTIAPGVPSVCTMGELRRALREQRR